jgi:GntR family transcriptional regulator, transcriptional repressor for pyruvate dehydrogenase complex
LPSERQLADDLNVKRHQLRKALQSLREAGELQPRPTRSRQCPAGYGEELVQLTNPLEVLELRLIMEPGFASLASLRASSVDIARILQAATTPTGSPAGEADLAFHFAVLRAARNHLAEELYKTMRQVGFDSRMKIARGALPDLPEPHRHSRCRAHARRPGHLAARPGSGRSRHAGASACGAEPVEPALQHRCLRRRMTARHSAHVR